MGYSIDKVKIGDEKILAYIQTESWKYAFKDILDERTLEKYTALEKAVGIYKKLLEQNIGNGYILRIDGNPYCIAWWDRTREEDMPGYAEIICIHSLPNNWRKGYGSKMMDCLLDDIKSSGYSKVMLWVFVDNERARKFYESKGFHATDKVQPAFGSAEICYELIF
jgi:ribosomal protein S18 acetylase RimI-like enzyme